MQRSHSTDSTYKLNKDSDAKLPTMHFEIVEDYFKINTSDEKIWNANQLLESVILRKEFTKHKVADLPCLSYQSETELVVLLTLEPKDFTKTRLFSLVAAAEALSPAC